MYSYFIEIKAILFFPLFVRVFDRRFDSRTANYFSSRELIDAAGRANDYKLFFGPVIDGLLVKEDPTNLLRKGEFMNLQVRFKILRV